MLPGVNVILGVNGLIWISAQPSPEDAAQQSPSGQQQESVSRTSNAIRVLAKLNFSITPLRILEIHQVRLFLFSKPFLMLSDTNFDPKISSILSSVQWPLNTSQGFFRLWMPPPVMHV